MVLKIIRYPAPSLGSACKPIDFASADPQALQEHLRDLKDTLAATQLGVALASNQVLPQGYRVFVVQPGQGLPEVAINPRWDPIGVETRREVEGCLSIPGLQLSFPRYPSIYFRYQDADGTDYAHEVKGMAARIVQHECDHLDGKLIVDRLTARERAQMRTALFNARKKGR